MEIGIGKESGLLAEQSISMRRTVREKAVRKGGKSHVFENGKE